MLKASLLTKKRPTSPRSSLHKDPSNLHNSIRGVLAVPRLDHGIFHVTQRQQLQKFPFHLGVEFIFFIHLIFLHILGGATRNVSKNHPKKTHHPNAAAVTSSIKSAGPAGLSESVNWQPKKSVFFLTARDVRSLFSSLKKSINQICFSSTSKQFPTKHMATMCCSYLKKTCFTGEFLKKLASFTMNPMWKNPSVTPKLGIFTVLSLHIFFNSTTVSFSRLV